MSDTLIVYEKCEHGKLEHHGGCSCGFLAGKKGRMDSDPEGIMAWWVDCDHDDVCPGGKEIVLRRMQTFPEGCWVEESADD